MAENLPDSTLVPSEGFEALVDFLRARRTVVLAGAGCSTESGIPDYRGPEGRMKTRRPVQYGEFVRSEDNRRRYWARSTVGWQRVSGAVPNPTHRGLAALEAHGSVSGLITQNVDGLHHAAGSRRVVELHGSLAHVICLDCGDRTLRSDMQARLLGANQDWVAAIPVNSGRPDAAPDGDAEIPVDVYAGFVVPECRICSGVRAEAACRRVLGYGRRRGGAPRRRVLVDHLLRPSVRVRRRRAEATDRGGESGPHEGRRIRGCEARWAAG